MDTKLKRIFVGNLPSSMSEADVTNRFKKFGDVLNIEIKQANDLSQSSYAFLDLNIDTKHLDSCFKKLHKEDWSGHSVKLELAKESFLSRLQRERQEKTGNSESTISTNTFHTKDTNFHGAERNLPNKLRTFVKRNDSSRPADCREYDKKPVNGYSSTDKPLETGILQDLESFSDVWKDPPTYNNLKRKRYENDAANGFEIVSRNGEEVPKIGSYYEKKTLNTNFASDEKRLKSIEEKKKYVLQQKQAVKLALASVDCSQKMNKKIVFDDDVIITPSTDLKKTVKTSDSRPTQEIRSKKKKSKLFEDESGSEEEQSDFQIKKQFEGRKGHKLLELQSNYANDERFNLDERFYDSEDNAEDDGETRHLEDPDSIQGERRRQLEILQSIVGDNLPFSPEIKKGQQLIDNMVVHYDPTREDHAKYEIKRVDKKKVLTSSKRLEAKIERKKKRKEERRDETATLAPTVSKEKFYQVSDSLKESLKTSKDAKGFSLLKMFASTEDNEETIIEETDTCNVTSGRRKPLYESSNPFKWDSSDSEEEPDETLSTSSLPVPVPALTQQQGPVQAQGIHHESFFFKTDDVRLAEGVDFFSRKEFTEDFSKHRKTLRQIVKFKVSHNLSKSQRPGRKPGVKSNGGFRRNFKK